MISIIRTGLLRRGCTLGMIVLIYACSNQEIRHDPPPAAPNQLELVQRADEAYGRSDWELSEQYYSKLVQQFPDNSRYWYRLGNVFAFTGRNNAAISAYNEALSRDPGDSTVWYNLGMTQLKQAAYVLNAMQSQVDPDDPVSRRANELLQGILELIQETQ